MTESQPGGCSVCGFYTQHLKHFEFDGGDLAEKRQCWLCHLCENTLTSQLVRYPSMFGDQDSRILRTLNYIGNCILAELNTIRKCQDRDTGA